MSSPHKKLDIQRRIWDAYFPLHQCVSVSEFRPSTNVVATSKQTRRKEPQWEMKWLKGN